MLSHQLFLLWAVPPAPVGYGRRSNDTKTSLSQLWYWPPVSSGGEWLWSGDLAELLFIQWHLIEESTIIWQFISEFHFLCIFRYNYSKRPGERGSRGRLQVIKSLNFHVWNLPTAAFVIPIHPSQVVRTLGLKRTICLKLVNSWNKAYMCKMRIKIPEIFLQFCVSQFLQYPTHFWTTSTENELIHKIKWADGQWLWLCTWGCHVGVNDHHWCYLDLIHAKLCSISSLFFHLGKIRKENGIWKMMNSLLIPFLPSQRHSSGYALLLPGQTIKQKSSKK